jgi:medium-chain acyl-[acyl-carrier-protein] hydrolase
LPGRENRLREQPCTSLTGLVETLATAMEPDLDRPYAIFGHSMGAWIAYELARELRRRYGRQPVHLFVSGRQAPQIAERQHPIHELPDAVFIAEIQRRYEPMPAAIVQDRELMDLLVPILRADLRLIESYTWTDDAPLDCPISAIGGLHDQRVSLDGLAAWRAHTTASFDLARFAGGHFFLHTARDQLLDLVGSAALRSLDSQSVPSPEGVASARRA